MHFFRKLWRWLKDPHGWQVCLLWAVTLAAAAGAVVLTVQAETPPLTYAAYALSAAAAVLLAYSVYTAVRYAPRIKQDFLGYTARFPKANRFFRDYAFRTVAFGILAFLINIGYAVLQMALAILLSSVWYGVLSGYYFCLGVLRCLLLAGWNKVKKRAGGDGSAIADGKLRLYRLCGIALLVLELALTAAVTQMVLSDNASRSSQIMAIASAAYTVYRVVLAIVNARKTYRLHDPLLQSFRNIGLTDAAVALLSLETTMIATFGGSGSTEMLGLRAATGFGVCALTIAMGVFMIVRGTQRLKELRTQGNDSAGADPAEYAQLREKTASTPEPPPPKDTEESDNEHQR